MGCAASKSAARSRGPISDSPGVGSEDIVDAGAFRPAVALERVL